MTMSSNRSSAPKTPNLIANLRSELRMTIVLRGYSKLKTHLIRNQKELENLLYSYYHGDKKTEQVSNLEMLCNGTLHYNDMYTKTQPNVLTWSAPSLPSVKYL